MFFCLFVGLIILNVIFFIEGTFTSSQLVSFTINNEKKIDVREENKYRMLVYTPESKYPLLNNTVNDKMNEYIERFKKDVDSEISLINQHYSLDIFYDTYEYKNYISYVFRIEYYTGGAHPSHEVWTVNYDKEKNEIIDINTLIEENSNILNIFSDISREELSHNKRIADTSMMMEGTSPKIENFSNFVYSNNGLILFFPPYQVAPYSASEFMIVIPYDKLY